MLLSLYLETHYSNFEKLTYVWLTFASGDDSSVVTSKIFRFCKIEQNRPNVATSIWLVNPNATSRSIEYFFECII